MPVILYPMTDDNEIIEAFGRHLRDLRKSRGWTQADFAEKTGFHHNYIGMAERGERNVSLKNLCTFAKALGISVSELLKEI
jgi:transcriptional regulator with XRE-family HTH domain